VDEQLHAASGLAGYAWGSLVLETSALAPADSAAILNTLSAATAGTLPGDSPRDQRAAIAFLHELIHLQQDLSTGLGAWDHVVTRVPYLRLAGQSRWVVWPTDQPPYTSCVQRHLDELGCSPFVDQMREDLAAVRSGTIGLRQLGGADWATPNVRVFLEGRVGQAISDDDIADLSLRRMLESEAACLTYTAVQKTRHSDDAQEWLTEHAELWMLPHMGEDYLGLTLMVGRALDGTEVTADTLWNWLATVASLVPWVVDLACAYPTPAHLKDDGLSVMAFEPVVRFSEIMRGLHRLDSSQVERIAEGVLGGNWLDAERALAASADLRYPLSSEIYGRWLDELAPLAESAEWDASLFQLRVDAIQARIDGHPPKGLKAVLDASTPIQVLVQNTGMEGINHAKHFANWDDMKRAFVDRRLDMEVFDLLHGSGVFSCPYGRAAKCPGQQPWCVDGLHRLDQLPQADLCYVRRSLESVGWALPDPVALR
jgi:hypothetical protein